MAAIHTIGNYLRVCKQSPNQLDKQFFHYSRNETNYREDVTGFNPRVIGFLDHMGEVGLIENNIAKASLGHSGVESTFRFTPTFHEMMDFYLADYGVQDITDSLADLMPVPYQRPRIIVKENLESRTKAQNSRAKASAPEIKGQKMEAIDRTLCRYNFLLNNSRLGFNLEWLTEQSDDIASLALNLNDHRGVFRQYADKEYKTHGRIYGGSWINLPSFVRQNLTINGQETIELDFQAMHPNILFTLAGAFPPFGDPYQITEGYKNDHTAPDNYRHLSKEVFMYASNSRLAPERFVSQMSRKAMDAFKEAMSDATEYTYDDLLEGNAELAKERDLFDNEEFKETLYRDITVAWKDIWHYFGEGGMNWRQLTKIESDIAYEVVKEITKLGKLILPVHDAFIALKEDKEVLEACMRDSYKKVLGITNDRYVPVIRLV